MSHAESEIPAWPGPGRPVRRAAFVQAVTAAATRSDWPAVLDALLDVPPDQVPSSLVMSFVVAALHEDRPGALSAAVSAAVEVDVPAPHRVGLAWRLAFDRRPSEAWTVLHADPATMTDPAAFAAVVQLLARIAGSPGAARELRAAAAALTRRYTNSAAMKPGRAPYAFPGGPTDPQPGPGPARILAAPGVPTPVVEAYRNSLARFEPTLARRSQPVVRDLRDVFVNRRGQIWLADGKVVEHRGQPVPEASRAAMADAPSVPEAVLAIESHHNIYHWLADWLPSLAWRFEPGAPDLPVLVSDDVAPFVPESLRLVGGQALPIERVGDALRVGRLFLGSAGAATIAPLGAHRRLLETLRGAVDAAPAPPGGTARRLYISRRDSAKRRLGNEEAVEAALAERGFRAMTFTGLPFATQARLVRGADVIVAPHGAGLAHLMLARPGTAVFEITPGSVAAAELTCCMARLSRLVGHRHLIWLEPRNPLTDAWSANLEAMLPALDAVLSGEATGLR
jgi:capsular polysaccharide biosynthesis protein